MSEGPIIENDANNQQIENRQQNEINTGNTQRAESDFNSWAGSFGLGANTSAADNISNQNSGQADNTGSSKKANDGELDSGADKNSNNDNFLGNKSQSDDTHSAESGFNFLASLGGLITGSETKENSSDNSPNTSEKNTKSSGTDHNQEGDSQPGGDDDKKQPTNAEGQKKNDHNPSGNDFGLFDFLSFCATFMTSAEMKEIIKAFEISREGGSDYMPETNFDEYFDISGNWGGKEEEKERQDRIRNNPLEAWINEMKKSQEKHQSQLIGFDIDAYLMKEMENPGV